MPSVEVGQAAPRSRAYARFAEAFAYPDDELRRRSSSAAWSTSEVVSSS
jgi:hypothetical protein